MDTSTKKTLSIVLILLGIAAAGSVGYAYYLSVENSEHWRWASSEIFQIIAGVVSAGVGISMLDSVFASESEKKYKSSK